MAAREESIPERNTTQLHDQTSSVVSDLTLEKGEGP